MRKSDFVCVCVHLARTVVWLTEKHATPTDSDIILGYSEMNGWKWQILIA